MAGFDFSGAGGDAPNREELLKMAIRSAGAGNKDAARTLFRQILGEDPRNERALLWMAKLAETKTERKQWLDAVLEIDPDNEIARKTLKSMAYTKSRKQNRTLLIFGVVTAVLFALGVAIVLLVLSSSG
jgi:hypothetical protein